MSVGRIASSLVLPLTVARDVVFGRRLVGPLAPQVGRSDVGTKGIVFGEVFDHGGGRNETLQSRIHVAGVCKIGEAADAGHGGVGLDGFLEL